MSTVLLHAHPAPSRSRHNRPMFERAHVLDGVEAVDLYALYPRFRIDVPREQERLVAHRHVVLHFPFYWYSVPALLKEYLDRVLEFGFAYGDGGDRLHGKTFRVATTTGGAGHAYSPDGHNRYTMETLLAPLEQTAHLCGMRWREPLVLHAANDDDAARIDEHVDRFVGLLQDDDAATDGAERVAERPA